MLFPRESFMVVGIAGKEPFEHPYVQFWPTGASVATDGYALAYFQSAESPSDEEFPRIEGVQVVGLSEPLAVARAACEQVLKALPKKTVLPVLGYAALAQNGEGHRAFVVTDLERVVRVKVGEGEDAVFPRWENVMPTSEPALTTAFNVEQLLRVAQLLDKLHLERCLADLSRPTDHDYRGQPAIQPLPDDVKRPPSIGRLPFHRLSRPPWIRVPKKRIQGRWKTL